MDHYEIKPYWMDDEDWEEYIRRQEPDEPDEPEYDDRTPIEVERDASICEDRRTQQLDNYYNQF